MGRKMIWHHQMAAWSCQHSHSLLKSALRFWRPAAMPLMQLLRCDTDCYRTDDVRYWRRWFYDGAWWIYRWNFHHKWREQAPAGATPDMFLDNEAGNPFLLKNVSWKGILSVYPVHWRDLKPPTSDMGYNGILLNCLNQRSISRVKDSDWWFPCLFHEDNQEKLLRSAAGSVPSMMGHRLRKGTCSSGRSGTHAPTHQWEWHRLFLQQWNFRGIGEHCPGVWRFRWRQKISWIMMSL